VALGVGHLFPVGFTGADGQGFDLRRGLAQPGVDLADLIEAPDRMTPTYVKPLIVEAGRPPREIERLDIKNRTPLRRSLEDEIVARMTRRLDACDGLIVADQVEVPNCGVITDRVREDIVRLGKHRRDRTLFADSRCRIGLFQNVLVKANKSEAVAALGLGDLYAPPELLARELSRHTQRPACITLGAGGLVACDGENLHYIPGHTSEGPIDIVGAGDSLTAGMASALCAGATLAEAALVSTLVASITVQQIGVTGTASPDQVRRRFREYRERFPELCRKI
jgi:bifunctional ADP-heptose synthase (sugar kinase/adenylyltransferase)